MAPSVKPPRNAYTAAQAIRDLDGRVADFYEIERLREQYPRSNYDLPHRQNMLSALFSDVPVNQLADQRYAGKYPGEPVDAKKWGSLKRAIPHKQRKAVIRLAYLRARITEGLDREAAHQRLLKTFLAAGDDKESAQSRIRKLTQNAKIDRPPEKT